MSRRLFAVGLRGENGELGVQLLLDEFVVLFELLVQAVPRMLGCPLDRAYENPVPCEGAARWGFMSAAEVYLGFDTGF